MKPNQFWMGVAFLLTLHNPFDFIENSPDQLVLGQCMRCAASSFRCLQLGQLVVLSPNHLPIFLPVAQKEDVCLQIQVWNMSGFEDNALS